MVLCALMCHSPGSDGIDTIEVDIWTTLLPPDNFTATTVWRDLAPPDGRVWARTGQFGVPMNVTFVNATTVTVRSVPHSTSGDGCPRAARSQGSACVDLGKACSVTHMLPRTRRHLRRNLIVEHCIDPRGHPALVNAFRSYTRSTPTLECDMQRNTGQELAVVSYSSASGPASASTAAPSPGPAVAAT